MQIQTIIVRPDGTRIKIEVRVHIDMQGQVRYIPMVSTQPKGARTWKPAVDVDRLTFKRMDADAKAQFENEAFGKLVSTEELQQAKEEVWRALKPETIKL